MRVVECRYTHGAAGQDPPVPSVTDRGTRRIFRGTAKLLHFDTRPTSAHRFLIIIHLYNFGIIQGHRVIILGLNEKAEDSG